MEKGNTMAMVISTLLVTVAVAGGFVIGTQINKAIEKN